MSFFGDHKRPSFTMLPSLQDLSFYFATFSVEMPTHLLQLCPCPEKHFRCFLCLIYFLVTSFLGCSIPFSYQSQQYHLLMMQKNNRDFWKCAVGSLIFFCTPALRSLPGEWVVKLETQLAKTLSTLSTQSRKHMK